ncbi:hypothetical protein B0A49_04255 [Cryomyces minteri]|uniref:Uncharacterized protein n=1 Tax=Cryomyces minteri TaxID=331657 RepID=A0A4U0XFA7_9PEZI|nr:hypothetical protein B0A49_04255 [Cryomyces minteri]
MSEAPTPAYTEKEIKMMGFAMQCLKSGPPDRSPSLKLTLHHPQVDMPKLAALAGYTNVNACGNAWRPLKKKIMANAEVADGTVASAPTPKTSPKKRGKAASATADDGETEESPTKKRKGRKSVKALAAEAAAAAAALEEDAHDDEGGEEEEEELEVKEEDVEVKEEVAA